MAYRRPAGRQPSWSSKNIRADPHRPEIEPAGLVMSSARRAGSAWRGARVVMRQGVSCTALIISMPPTFGAQAW